MCDTNIHVWKVVNINGSNRNEVIIFQVDRIIGTNLIDARGPCHEQSLLIMIKVYTDNNCPIPYVCMYVTTRIVNFST